MKRLFRVLAASSLFACTVLTTARAGEPDAFVPVEPPAEDGWTVNLQPYFWFAGLDGDVGFNGNVGEVDMDFGDIWDALEFGLMGNLNFQKGRWSFMVDGLWLKLEEGGDLDGPGPIEVRMDAEIEVARVQGLVGYRVFDDGPTRIDLKAGAAWFYMNLDFDVKGSGPLARSLEGSKSESFIDPMLALEIVRDLGERWYIAFRGQIGGFGVESDFIWQAGAFLGYRISDRYSVGLGYRHLDIDYDTKDFVFDAAMSGPFVGGNISF